MSFVDKFLTAIQLNGDEDQGYYDEPDDSFTSKVESINNQAPIGKDDPSIEVKEEKKPAKVTPRPKKSLSAAGMEVCVIKPTSVEDAREITETLLANRTVVLNLEGLDVDIVLTSGADAVAASILSGDADIGFCGSEQTIYIYNEGSKDYLINFAGLTKRDGSFIVSRNKETFKLEKV